MQSEIREQHNRDGSSVVVEPTKLFAQRVIAAVRRFTTKCTSKLIFFGAPKRLYELMSPDQCPSSQVERKLHGAATNSAVGPLRKSGRYAHTYDMNKLRQDHGKVSLLVPSLRCRHPPGTEAIAGHSGPGRSLVQFVGRGYLVERPKCQIDKTVRPGMTKKDSGMKLAILPLTPDLWPALEDLLASGVPAMAAGACIGASAAPIAGSAAKTKRRCERSSSVVPRRACSPSTAIWRWAGVRSCRAARSERNPAMKLLDCTPRTAKSALG